MNPRVERYRQSWRLRIPPDPGETRRIERWLATARVFLAVSTLVAIRMDPTELGHSWAAYGLFVFYLANGILILMLLRRRQQIHCCISSAGACGRRRLAGFDFNFRRGPRTPFLPVLLFRAGGGGLPLGTLGDAGHGCGGSGLTVDRELCIDSSLACSWRFAALASFAGLASQRREFEPQRLFMLSVYLIVMGLLLGYLAEQQKHLRAEKAVVTGHSVEGTSGSGTDRDDGTDLPANDVDVRGVAAAGGLAGNP